jgi:flagellar biosynthesis/type III secretory pathway chaperone
MEDCRVEKNVAPIYQIIQKLIGLHRNLMDVVRAEREALTNADLKGIQDANAQKEALVQAIRQQEADRLRTVGELAIQWKRPFKDLSLQNIIIAVQGTDLKAAEQLRSSFNALTHLVSRVQEQNRYNAELLEKSLAHLLSMKKNILGEATPKSDTYNPQGQKTSSSASSRLISKEA